MKALYFKTGEQAQVVDVSGTLREYQMLVDGPIETLTLWWDDVVLICNEEGTLIEGIMPNRVIYYPGSEVNYNTDNKIDIYGDFLLVGWTAGSDDWTDIPETMIKKYQKLLDDKYHMWQDREGEWSIEVPER